MMGFGFGMGIWGILVMVLFWGGLVALAVWLVGLMFPSPKNPNPNAPLSAEEITEAEYKQMKETLSQF